MNKQTAKIREMINARIAKLEIDFDLMSEEESKRIRHEILLLQHELTKGVKSRISGYYVPTVEKIYRYIYELIDYEERNEPLFLYEEQNHHYTIWESIDDYRNNTGKIGEVANERELAHFLLRMRERRVSILESEDNSYGG